MRAGKTKSRRQGAAHSELAPELPRASEAERVVVGAVILGNDDIALLKLRSEDFFNKELACVYSRVREMQIDGTVVDLATVVDELRAHGELESIGGAGVVSSWLDGLPRRLAMDSYVRAIRDKAFLRKLSHLGLEISDRALGNSMTPREIILTFERKLSDLKLDTARSEERLSGDDSVAEILDKTASFISRFVVMSSPQLDIVALWIFHTHAFNAANVTGYLAITSAEKRCGKTLLLEILGLLVDEPWLTGRATPAVLVRKIHSLQPTLLLDESDAAFSDEDSDYSQVLRGMLNVGYRRGGVHSCCVGQGAEMTWQDFSAFCPKAIAGIGQLPDTVADRSFPIRLQRRAGREYIERFNRSEIEAEAVSLRNQVGSLVASVFELLKATKPSPLDQLGDRENEIASPLLAIADVAGGDWPERARAGLVELFGSSTIREESLKVRLLRDIRCVFQKKGAEKIATVNLLEHLKSDENAPWCELNNGKGLTPRGLSKMLKEFGIQPEHFRDGSQTPRGYLQSQFRDAWERYCVATALSSGTTGTVSVFNDLGVPVETCVPHASGTDNLIGTDTLLKTNHVPDVSDVPLLPRARQDWSGEV